ncbi:hypothetical protein FK498_00905 [Elioraea sp. Yellowstone]|jgi:hypothetical protein|uniref:hypothetical protein n=1 Tax=Elioraea sp. Yellowstone TaxID=2592070 RepID=UPI001150EC21|nr:hypothetical protein [Elioraea sp. Yellowstone]TQF85274.1 hypothetical protein FK498_00905 [Elioraea sp. Yellowstone]
MDDLFWSAPLGANRTLCVSTLSQAALAQCEVEAFGSDFGYFVYEVDERPRSAGISVLAKATSEDAAVRLAEILALRFAADATAPPLTAV